MIQFDLKNRAIRKMRQMLRRREVRGSFVHLSGPRMTRLDDHEVALVILARDMEYFLPHHIQYHLDRGVSRIVYVDNGSSDGSIAAVQKYEQATVATCSANFRKDEGLMRYFANTLYLKGGWRLAIDPDELLDYPGSGSLSLPDLTRKMASRGYSALVAQMLEMVPEGPLSKAPQDDFQTAARTFRHYDLRNISRFPYHENSLVVEKWFLDQNVATNPEIEVLFGGLRNSVFDENCFLTKHPLFRMGPGVVPMPHPHVSIGLTCTDFSAVLKHYKFANDVLSRERKLLDEGRIAHSETVLRVAKLGAQEDMDFGPYTLEEDPTIEILIEKGFLKITPEAARDLGMERRSAG